MRKFAVPLLSTLLLLSPLAQGGVVMDLVSTNASGQETERSRIYAQSGKMRMEQVDGTDQPATMIFLGDSFLYIDHQEKSYVVMDEAMLNEVSAQMSDAMKQMEAELAKMPPEQRAMVEQMMKGRMPEMAAEQSSPGPTVKATGKGEWKSYKCRQYEVFEGASKSQDICAAGLGEISGADEVVETFRSMAAYLTKLAESMPMRSDDLMNPGELMDKIDGFPVHTVDYENGAVIRETSLDAVAEQTLDDGLFAAPEGYQRQELMRRR